jgi:uncharacterized protein YcnI
MRTRLARGAAVAAAAALALPAAASAHVTLQPQSAPAGSYAVFDVRVPNERDDSATTKVEVKLPPGFVSASWQPVPGWRATVEMERLARPLETENGPLSEQVSTVTWSGGTIPPGAFQDFPISVKLPDRAGETLTFKAVQTYANGEVVRWIGAPDADEPAPQVTLTAAAGEGDGAGAGHDDGDAAGGDTTTAATGSAASPGSDSGSDDDGSSDGLAIAGLVVGAAGLLAGGAALLTARRRPAA